jgi:hypothetical protein
LSYDLELILVRVPVGRYMLALGNRGYCTGYLKLNRNTFKWLYNGESKTVGSYWEPSDEYIILPEDLEISTKISYEDDDVKVWKIKDSSLLIYDGIEDSEPMKNENWRFCSELGVYYLADHSNRTTYIKMKVNE